MISRAPSFIVIFLALGGFLTYASLFVYFGQTDSRLDDSVMVFVLTAISAIYYALIGALSLSTLNEITLGRFGGCSHVATSLMLIASLLFYLGLEVFIFTRGCDWELGFDRSEQAIIISDKISCEMIIFLNSATIVYHLVMLVLSIKIILDIRRALRLGPRLVTIRGY